MFITFVAVLIVFIWIYYRVAYPRRCMLRALERGEFIAYIQPIVDGFNDIVYGGEILMRWNHRSKGIISPDIFIPIAEKNRLIVPMTRSLMYQVQMLLGPRASALPPRFHFSFNITVSHLRDSSLVGDCKSFIAAFSKNPIQLILELTESEQIVFDQALVNILDELRGVGVSIAIDDFGTGYSRLLYFQKIKIDTVKIDRSFISALSEKEEINASHIVDNIIDLGNRMGMSIIAEGVENREQAEFLIEHGINLHQGYFYGKPKPIGSFYAELSRQVNRR